MRDVLVNYITNGKYDWYRARTQRMANSFIDNGFTGNIMLMTEENSPEIPTHSEGNYMFKAFSLLEAYGQNHEVIIWSDCPMILKKPYKVLRDEIMKRNVFVPRAGRPDMCWSVGQWATDDCLKYFKITRDEAFKIPVAVSGFFAVNAKSDIGRKILFRFFANCTDKAVSVGPRYSGAKVTLDNKAYLGHRPDQVALSILCWQEKIPLVDGLWADPENGCGYPQPLRVTDQTIVEWRHNLMSKYIAELVNSIPGIETMSYLELGLYNGNNFRRIRAADKESVDIEPLTKPTHLMTTDEFFRQNKRRFDIVFIDADHRIESVIKDYNNAIQICNKFIFIHDMVPDCKQAASPEFQQGKWCGDGFKMLAWFLKYGIGNFKVLNVTVA